METAVAVAGARFFSPVGELGLWAGPGGLCEVRWLKGREQADRPEVAHPVLARAVATLERYFRGHPLGDVPLDLSFLSPFRRRVMLTLKDRVPPGHVVSYGELACLAGHPGAARAVGTVMSQNTLPLFVPCHRVVGAAGPGGFGPGLALKQKLLRLEGFELAI